MGTMRIAPGVLLWAWLLLGIVNCGGSAGEVCAIDSDCGAGLWCDRRVNLCAAVDCQGEECAIPVLADALTDAELPDAIPSDSAGSDAFGPFECDELVPSGESQSWRVTAVRVGASGKPGHGLDIDDDAATCAPAGNCEEGIDNAFAGVAAAVNLFYDTAMSDGALQLGVILTDTGCGALRLVFTEGHADQLSVSSGSLDGETYKSEVGPASLQGNTIQAGPGGRLMLPLVVLGALVEVPVLMTRATGNIEGATGVLTWAGALRKVDLEAAVRTIPAEKLAPLDADGAIGLLNGLYAPDLDLDEDGTKDAASIGWIAEIEAASIAMPQE